MAPDQKWYFSGDLEQSSDDVPAILNEKTANSTGAGQQLVVCVHSEGKLKLFPKFKDT